MILERAALLRAVGSKGTVVVDEPRAAANGPGVNVGSRWARMVVDVGEGITEAAVFRDGRMFRTLSLRIALDEIRASEERVLREFGRLLRGSSPRRGSRCGRPTIRRMR